MDFVHDRIVDELFTYKSIAALLYLINAGRELECNYKNISVFISRDGSIKHCSLWVDKSEQAFDCVEELFTNAVIQEKRLKDIWAEVELVTLF